jgi:hypothetical protein
MKILPVPTKREKTQVELEVANSLRHDTNFYISGVSLDLESDKFTLIFDNKLRQPNLSFLKPKTKKNKRKHMYVRTYFKSEPYGYGVMLIH